MKIASKKILLNVSDNPYLAEGIHRIYFSSALDFVYNPEKREYSIDFEYSTSPQTILDVISYFDSNDLDINLDIGTQKIVDGVEKEEQKLKDGIIQGNRIHKNPPSKIKVPHFKRKLKKYQNESVEHIIDVGNSANFSVPGSGKTTIVYAAYSILKEQGVVDKLLVIGPRSSFMPWEEEYFSCFGKNPDVLRITGSISERKKKYARAGDYELFLATYHMAYNDLSKIINFLKKHNVMVVLDESHYIKRFEGGRWAEALLELAPCAKRRVILTGTPMPHGIFDLWTQMTFLWPHKNLLLEREQFKTSIESDLDLLSLRKELSPLYCRIKKSELDLPVPSFVRIKVPLNPIQKTIYDSIAIKVLKDFIKSKEERINLRQWRRAKLIRLLQAASNPTLLEKYSDEFDIPPLDTSGLQVSQLIKEYPRFEIPSKIEITEKLVRDLVSKKQKVIIWTSFIHNIEMMRKKVKDLDPICVYGEVPLSEDEDIEYNRERLIKDFKTNPKKFVFVANPGATAESISLHRTCHNAIYLDRTFNGAQYLQSLDRIHRIGLEPDEKVTYTLLISEDTIDEIINARLEEKLQNMLDFLNEDLNVSNIDISASDISDGENEEIADFNAVIDSMKEQYGLKHDTEYK